MINKVCSKCKVEKPEGEFYLREDSGKRRNECKLCISNNRKSYYISNKLKVINRVRNYYINNKHIKNTYNKLYYKNNKEKFYIYGKEYRKINKDKVNISRSKWFKERYPRDIQFKLRYLLRSRFLLTIKKDYRKDSSLDLLGCSVSYFKKYLESLFKDNMSWDNHGKWHIDHIVPLSCFDLTDSEQISKAFHYTNLQPLWGADNIRKGGKNRYVYSPRL